MAVSKLVKQGSVLVLFIILVFSEKGNSQSNYINNKALFSKKPYLELPLGSLKGQGWLKEQLIRQKEGVTGHLDELYPLVIGERNGWLGGDGDQWERAPYWIDGLLPLAYILDDEESKIKVESWIERSIENHKENGYFGHPPPAESYPSEVGTQCGNIRDWCPKMVMLNVLKQYYSATLDKRVIKNYERLF